MSVRGRRFRMRNRRHSLERYSFPRQAPSPCGTDAGNGRECNWPVPRPIAATVQSRMGVKADEIACLDPRWPAGFRIRVRAHAERRALPSIAAAAREPLPGQRARVNRARRGPFAKSLKPPFSQIKGFCEYGFPEGHSTSFALLAYSSVWSRHYEPAVFLTALLNSQPTGFLPAVAAAAGRDAARRSGAARRRQCEHAGFCHRRTNDLGALVAGFLTAERHAREYGRPHRARTRRAPVRRRRRSRAPGARGPSTRNSSRATQLSSGGFKSSRGPDCRSRGRNERSESPSFFKRPHTLHAPIPRKRACTEPPPLSTLHSFS